jgi:type VI secretion system protein ImpJ
MNKAEKVVWTEGMFLRPHHFQRAESHLHSHIREWGRYNGPGYGAFWTLNWMTQCCARAVSR